MLNEDDRRFIEKLPCRAHRMKRIVFVLAAVGALASAVANMPLHLDRPTERPTPIFKIPPGYQLGVDLRGPQDGNVNDLRAIHRNNNRHCVSALRRAVSACTALSKAVCQHVGDLACFNSAQLGNLPLLIDEVGTDERVARVRRS
jgi:hypothetical protein